MDGWSALFVIAGTVSLTSFLSSCAGPVSGRVVREEETLRRAIHGSLESMDRELVSLESAAGDAGLEGKKEIFEEIGRLDVMKEDLLAQEKKLRSTHREEWNGTRDETLRILERIRRHLTRERPTLAL